MKSILIGFGRIANSIRHDKKMGWYFQYRSHAQVLNDHPDFDWIGVVDPDDEAVETARREWKVCAYHKIYDNCEAEFAVLAIPPGPRLEVLKSLPDLKAVLIEKPLGPEGAEFLQVCKDRNIQCSINFWRRGDILYRELANGGIKDRIGDVQAVFCTYGNGLFNNGSHMVDFMRMLFGEPKSVRTIGTPEKCGIVGCSGAFDDWRATFALEMGDFNILVHPLDYGHYREFGLDIWGTKGRLALYQESLGIQWYQTAPHRAMENQTEVRSDLPTVIPNTVRNALYNLYTSIAEGNPVSPATTHTEDILNAVVAS